MAWCGIFLSVVIFIFSVPVDSGTGMLVAVVLFFASCAGGLIHYGRMFSHSLDQLDEHISFGRPLTAEMRQTQIQANDWLKRCDRLKAREIELNQTSTRISHPRAWAKFDRQRQSLNDDGESLHKAMIDAGWDVPPLYLR
jgi:hypothetical protein